ncbi:MAG: cytochrome P450 [Candidatus Binatia bacterium]
MPPRVGGPLPWVEAGAALLRDPTACFAAARRRHGDTFVLDAFGYRLFCVFSAAGVARLYGLAEHEASFGLATFELVLKRKLPAELLVGRRTFPHALFGGQEVEDYLGHLHDAMRVQLDELGADGTFEAFALARRLGHRLGLGAWAGREAAAPGMLDRLIPHLDRLDSGDSFVRPAQAFVTALTRKAPERRAMGAVEAVIGDILRARRRSGVPVGDYLERIAAPFAALPEAERDVQTARDVMVIHMGAQSNLYAALAWTLVNLLREPALLARVGAGDDALLEQCANESIRMAQRSITLRYVMSPLDFDDGTRTYRLDSGVMITTMLPLNNTSAAPGLERFDPAHYEGRKLSKQVALPARELVSTFGHGRHACPAQRFSISAIRIAVRALVDTYELTPRFTDAQPRRRQIGGVARAAAPCPVAYRRRATA